MKYLKRLFFTFLFSQMALSQQDTIPQKLISVIGVGDIMLGSNYPSKAKLPINDGKNLLDNVKAILTDADVTFGNLEGCFLDEGGSSKNCKSGCYFFRMPNRYVNYLTEAGFDVMSIANNHSGDFGELGRKNTQKVLSEAGIEFAGIKNTCEVARFERNGVRYGFVAFAPNTGTVSIKDIPYAQKLVSELNEDCDIVIVSFHGGAEGKAHTRVPKKTEIFHKEDRGNVYKFARAVVDAGADIVFGHGPHVVRASELYKDRFIIYSLGNFCTAGDFTISGISGYAPMVKVFTDKEGKFVKGQIFSALQKDKTGPIMDTLHLAAKEIKRLTALDFPKTELSISEEGMIERTDTVIPSEEKPLQQLIDNQLDSISVSSNLSTRESIVEFSKKYLGTPYRSARRGPDAFDCSGFTHYVFKNFGVELTPQCSSQILQGKRVKKENLQIGDLVFFKGRNIKSNRAGHVGIVVSNENGKISFIHASTKRGVVINEVESSKYYNSRYITGLRVLPQDIHIIDNQIVTDFQNENLEKEIQLADNKELKKKKKTVVKKTKKKKVTAKKSKKPTQKR